MTMLYGIGPVLEALRAARRKVRRVHVASGRESDARVELLLRLARERGSDVRQANREQLARMADGGVHQGVVADADPLPVVDLSSLLEPAGSVAPLVVALDGVQDPQNLGAILRIAECAGVRALLVPRDRSAPLTPAAMKVAEGAAEYVPVVVVVNLTRALEELKQAGLWAIALDASAGKDWCEVDLRGPTVLVLGSEGKGVRRLVRETCDESVAIPLQGRLESLNVSAAAAAVLYETVRQRRGGSRPSRDA